MHPSVAGFVKNRLSVLEKDESIDWITAEVNNSSSERQLANSLSSPSPSDRSCSRVVMSVSPAKTLGKEHSAIGKIDVTMLGLYEPSV